ncbi:hypothetical protein HJG60_010194 [Phyllostomus discolor]|uniref:Uncharacterized protein n=1 Tax=Phyllostomus discolor TaxID=89673 RepID=A0A834AYW9_9CHIR|nr:hypothetical protein HJG60_010194 [Phyllostomus discolor]
MGILGLRFLASTYTRLFITLAHLSSDFCLPAFCLHHHQNALVKHLLTCVERSQDEHPTKALLLRDTVWSGQHQGTCTFRQTRCPLVFCGPSLFEALSRPLQWYERESCHNPHLHMRELAMCYDLICVPPSLNVKVLTSSTSEGDLVWR